MAFELGVYSFGNTPRAADGTRGPTAQAVRDVLEAIRLAEEVGLDFFGVGEHHMRAMPLSSPTAVVNAAAASTSRIKLGTTVTVLSTDEPIRVFEQLATAASIAPGPDRGRRRARVVDDHVSALRLRGAGLRHALPVEARIADGDQRQRAGDVERAAPKPAAHRRVDRASPGVAVAHLVGNRRQSRFGVSSGRARAADVPRDPGRHARALGAVRARVPQRAGRRSATRPMRRTSPSRSTASSPRTTPRPRRPTSSTRA